MLSCRYRLCIMPSACPHYLNACMPCSHCGSEPYLNFSGFVVLTTSCGPSLRRWLFPFELQHVRTSFSATPFGRRSISTKYLAALKKTGRHSCDPRCFEYIALQIGAEAALSRIRPKSTHCPAKTVAEKPAAASYDTG